MGQHEKAAAELRRVVGETRDEVLLYIACMALAAEEQALGRPGAARELYGRAAALFPSAPSPRLALGHLMREAGDREAAVLSVMDAIRPRAIDDYADPWWSYDLLPGRRCWTLLEEVRRMAPEAESR
jgi:hypothetical protein